MAKRSYTKKNDSYWGSFQKKIPAQGIQAPVIKQAQAQSFEPTTSGEPFYVSTASYSRGSTPSRKSRINRAAVDTTIDRFSSIRSGLLPYDYSADGVSVRDAIELCQKAYANVAIFRNAIDIMAEFANTDIYLEGGTKKARDFFYDWFKKINLDNLKDQYFREYYRSGNIFLYRVDGKFSTEDFVQLVKLISEGAETDNTIPIRYILLNPYDIVADPTSSFAEGSYNKVLSKYEISSLRNASNEDDVKILSSLPTDVQKKIKDGSYQDDGVLISLDASKLSFSFYKKQDYEPFAVPFGYSVLEDINAKLELKKMDQAITRTVENVILLITMGAEPDKGGINDNNLNAMQSLFANESVGRVLVADYTTEAEFIIPDLNKVLGPDKYQVLNEDIKQGLQNIVVGEEKFSSTQVKAQIFIDRLKETRSSFVSNFLQKEIKRVSKALGFRSYPKACFKDVDMRDETQLMRVATRLMELGVITPQQCMDMFETGKFPKSEDIAPAQEEFLKERKKGLYNPIVGGVPVIAPPAAPEVKGTAKNTTKKVAGRPEGTTGIPLEDSKATTFSRKAIEATITSLELLREASKSRMIEALKIKDFGKNHEKMLDKLCEAVACSSDVNNWTKTAASCVNNLEQLEKLNVLPEILEIAAAYELETYPASVLYHSQQISSKE